MRYIIAVKSLTVRDHLEHDVQHDSLLSYVDKERLQPSMSKFFRRLDVAKPVWRNNFFFQAIDEHDVSDLDPLELAWSETMGGPEDATLPKRPYTPKVMPSTIMYRSEKQTLRRLPKTGAIVFT
jgi:hypothetical protein